MRRPRIEDVPAVLKLAKMVHFINLPADKDILSEKVQWSRNCFVLAAESVSGLGKTAGTVRESAQTRMEATAFASGLRAVSGQSPLFMFLLEDLDSSALIGTSQIISRMGGPELPNLSFQLSRKDFFSSTLQVGANHVVAKLHLDTTGPTEIGGLIAQPSMRGHKRRLGRFLSYVRFHFMGLYRGMFSDRVLAELMAPFSPDGHNPFWEYLGRRFINLTYEEADRFCQHSKEFMLSLLPREEIYLTLLPPEARSVVGQVGAETVPAKRLLENLGFKYFNRVDPFDGGPHLEADTDAISLVKTTFRAEAAEPIAESQCRGHGMVSVMPADGEFRCVETLWLEDRTGGVIRLPREAMSALRIEPGEMLGATPTAPPPEFRAAVEASGLSSSSKPAKKKSVSRGKTAAKR
jgi:arginine N-succinyltransferase